MTKSVHFLLTIYTPRFSGTIRDSVSKLTATQGLKIAEHLFKYIFQNLNKRLFDTHELILSDFLIDVTKSDPNIRYSLFKRIFNVKDTGFFLYSYSWVISKWDKLTENEKSYIIDIFSSKRKDLRWIKAGAITNQFLPPSEIQNIIFKNDTFLVLEISEILKKIDKQLFFDSLKIYSGEAHVIDYYGLGHCSKLWAEICCYILQNNHEDGYEISLKLFLNDFINGSNDNEWGDMKKLWKIIFKTNTDKDNLVILLIDEISNCNCCTTNIKSAFKAIIKWYKKNNKIDILIAIISEKIEILTKTSNDFDLIEFLSYDNFLLKSIIPALKNHNEMLQIVYDLKNKEFNQAEIKNKVTKVLNLAEVSPIRLFVIFDYIDDIVKANKIGETNISKLQSLPNSIKITQKEYNKDKTVYNDDYIGLDGWHSLLGEPDLIYYL
ncbi:MAG: hypothetical protein HQ490_06750 [Lutibacter sp.]|nr:hypothetical protein [Lutibacter sp.]